jgi:uncharacterized protein (DUF433 family)
LGFFPRLTSSELAAIVKWSHHMKTKATRNGHLIESNPGVMMGKPVIAGTRITVELILEKLGAGETVDDLLTAHPRLTRRAIQAALAFAADALRADVVYPLVEAGR